MRNGDSMLMDVRESRLGNGIRIITSEIPRVESVTLGIWVGVGGRHEPARFSGASHLIEHMLFKGTKKRSARDISRAIEGRGGYLNAFTQEDNTCYYASIPSEWLGLTLNILTDMYLNARFDLKDVEKEKGVVLEEIMMYRDQPQHVVQEILGKAMWKGHPIGRPISGTPETVKGMTRGDLVRYKDAKYVSANTVFAIAGKLDHDACVEMVAGHVAHRKPATKPAWQKVTSNIGQDSITLRSKEIEQAHLALGIRLPFGTEDRRRYTLKVLNVVLGENMSSRLFQVVREKHGLAYHISSSFQLLQDTGALVVSAGLDRKRPRRAVELIANEVTRLKERPVPGDELKRAKDYVCGQIRLGLESTRHQMMWVGDNIMAHGRFVPPEDVINAISAVTPEDVQHFACTFLRRSKSTLAMVAPNLPDAAKKQYTAALAKL
jgi:predicted Zn-dependent peptidase